MRILHVIASLSSGGAEKLLVDIVLELRQKNIDCEVLVLTSKNNFFGHILEENNIQVYYSSTNKIYSIKNILYLINMLRNTHYDVIHTHLYSAQIFTSFAELFTNKSIPLITTEHSTNNNRRNKKIFKILDSWMYNRYMEIIAITPEVKKSLELYLPNTFGKITTIFNGIDLEVYKKASSLKKNDVIEHSSRDIWVIMVAGLRPAKDHETLIRASKILPENYRIIFVGEGARRGDLEEYAQRNGSNKITFLGARSDVPNLLKTSDIFVLSSHWEGFGLALVEAAAANLPIIASDVPGMDEVAKQVGAQLFTSGNEAELAKYILNVEHEKNNNKATNLKNFTIKKTISEYSKIYRKVVKS